MRGYRIVAGLAVAPWFRLVPAALLALTAGCGSVADPPPRQAFLVQLDPGAGGARPQRKAAAAVYVAAVVVAAPFSGRSLVVRQSQLGFAADPYAEFAANPVSMWTDAMRNWLDARQLFERVLSYDSRADATLTLETNLLEAVIDRRPGQPAASRITVRFLLIGNAQPYQVLLDRTFTRTEAVNGAGPEREVAALSLAFEDALRDLEEAVTRMPN
ncbi:MAG TPA: ABC-type transport auxiliary lipoprotein family protein [Burkholderiaceae bacterium]|nr:ABC-type transport auxiliary lipoprotein family protein [Burkholderiaceae bacterium]